MFMLSTDRQGICRIIRISQEDKFLMFSLFRLNFQFLSGDISDFRHKSNLVRFGKHHGLAKMELVQPPLRNNWF